MDPFLEDPAYWPDFHSRFINYWCEAIAERLPDRYDARIGERVNLVEQEPDAIRRIEPDVAVSHWGESGDALGQPAGGAVATLEPVTIPLVIEEPARQTYIEILRRPDRNLVAVLELLSPANKTGPGRGEYLAKRNAILRQDVHLLELDLLLQGERMPLRDPLPPGDYYALVARADRRPDCDVYAWTLRNGLPTVPIPLRPPDADVRIDLAAVMRTTYDRGRYARSVDYNAAPEAVRSSPHRAWVLQQAAADGDGA
jgi:hypothetical protein